MSRGFKIFLISFMAVCPFWWLANVLGKESESFFFWHQMASNPQILLAQANQERLEQQLRELKPFRNRDVAQLQLEAKSALALRVLSAAGKPKALFAKNAQAKVPIASLSKLMTALIVLENYALSQEVEMSAAAVSQEEETGGFRAGERFKVLDLLYSMLIESSNDAAYALAEVVGQDSFLNLMNLKAEELALAETRFVNVNGLTPDNLEGPYNYSTANGLAVLAFYLMEKQPLLWQITATPQAAILQADGRLHHLAKNTNRLLGEMPAIIGGKTGYTDEAGGCYLLMLKSPDSRGYIASIVLGSPDKFAEMRRLIDWLNRAYEW